MRFRVRRSLHAGARVRGDLREAHHAGPVSGPARLARDLAAGAVRSAHGIRPRRHRPRVLPSIDSTRRSGTSPGMCGGRSWATWCWRVPTPSGGRAARPRRACEDTTTTYDRCVVAAGSDVSPSTPSLATAAQPASPRWPAATSTVRRGTDPAITSYAVEVDPSRRIAAATAGVTRDAHGRRCVAGHKHSIGGERNRLALERTLMAWTRTSTR